MTGQVPGGDPAANDMRRRLDDKLHEMHERELLDFVRETVAQLNSLSDRLEAYVEQKQGDSGA